MRSSCSGLFWPFLALVAAIPDASAAADICRKEVFEGSAFTVCTVDLGDSDLRMFWRRSDGAPYRTFGALADTLAENGLALAFAMNGGMYREDFSPVGLYVEGGATLSEANTAAVTSKPVPNFYKKPNGVFFLGADGAGVLETGRYLQQRLPVDFATQSGPMLVLDGDLHPAFIPDSSFRQPRNGVGVCSPGKVHFAMSEGAVNFHDFGRFFRDRLGCDNALFLDGGSAPGLYAPDLRRNDPPGHGGYGPIIGVVEPLP